jgi:alkanesulfonate monooxygenase SsuD/methylene tetrahydromethanopterin reductase-like flavin-dependent oxidoreductase (luciferase family)
MQAAGRTTTCTDDFRWHVVCSLIGYGVHLFVSLAAHGWHPAAWRVSGQPGFDGVAPFVRAAQAAERAAGKLDSLHFDPLPLAGLLIGATRHIGLCGYWPADVAEPFHVARVFATLDHLSGGRMGWIVGLGGPAELTGRFQRADLALSDADANARFVELIDVARQLWDSWEDKGFVVDQATGTFAASEHVHPIEHAGRFFTVRGPLNVPRPVQGQPVILHRDVPAPARAGLAASADVVLGEPATLAEAKAARAAWQALSPDVRYVVRLEVILGEAAAKRAADLDAMAADDRLRFVGTPEQLAAHLAEWHTAGACDGFDILLAVMPVDLDLLADEVVPRLRARGLRPGGYNGRTLREHLGLERPPSRFAA